jgi:hypothetical protein
VVQEPIKERIAKLRQEIAKIKVANEEHWRGGTKSLAAIPDHERRQQRLKEILDELASHTDWKKLWEVISLYLESFSTFFAMVFTLNAGGMWRLLAPFIVDDKETRSRKSNNFKSSTLSPWSHTALSRTQPSGIVSLSTIRLPSDEREVDKSLIGWRSGKHGSNVAEAWLAIYLDPSKLRRCFAPEKSFHVLLLATFGAKVNCHGMYVLRFSPGGEDVDFPSGRLSADTFSRQTQQPFLAGAFGSPAGITHKLDHWFTSGGR